MRATGSVAKHLIAVCHFLEPVAHCLPVLCRGCALLNVIRKPRRWWDMLLILPIDKNLLSCAGSSGESHPLRCFRWQTSITTLSRSISTLRRIVHLTLIANAFLWLRVCRPNMCCMVSQFLFKMYLAHLMWWSCCVWFECQIQKYIVILLDANT